MADISAINGGPRPISTTTVGRTGNTTTAPLASNTVPSPSPAGRIPTTATPITPVRRS